MNTNSKDEIDLIDILQKIYYYRKNILFITSIFIFLGTTISLLSPVKYTSTTVFIPQNQKTQTSSLSGVAGLVGINLGNDNYGGVISTAMYPKIAESIEFKRLLLSEVIDSSIKLTLGDFIVKDYNLEKFDNVDTYDINVSDVEEKSFKILSDILSININNNDGFISISSTISVAKYSPIVAKKAKDILQKIIIKNRIESARQNLIFTEKQLVEKKILFNEIQSKLANFTDSNLNSVNSSVINEKGKLQAEFEIINSVVVELSKQVEQAKLQVTKDTPVFSTIQSATIPNKRSSPNRTQIVLIISLSGLILSTIFFIIKDFIYELLYNLKKPKK